MVHPWLSCQDVDLWNSNSVHLNMVSKHDSTAHTLWIDIESLFRDNKEAHIMELENELRQMTMGDKSVNEFYERMKVTTDLLGNIMNLVIERTLVTYFLNGLNPKYVHIAAMIRQKEPLPALLQPCSIFTFEEGRPSRSHPQLAHHSDHDSAPIVLYTRSLSPP